MSRLIIATIFIAVTLIRSAAIDAQVSPSLIKNAETHWQSMISRLESVYSGEYQLVYEFVESKDSRSQCSGVFSFDFRTGNAKYSQSSPRAGAFWARNEDHDIVYLPRASNEGSVTLNHRGTEDVLHLVGAPFDDFRVLPDLTIGNMLSREPLNMRKKMQEGLRTIIEYEKGADVDLITVQYKPPQPTLDLMLDELPAQMHLQVLDLKAKGILIPASTNRTVYSFSAMTPGLLLRKKFLSLGDDLLVTELSDYQIEWDKCDGYFVPTKLSGSFGDSDLKVALNWERANVNFPANYFSVDGYEEIKGLELFDARLPDRDSLGLIGADKLVVFMRSNGISIFILLLLVVMILVSIFAIRRKT